MIKTIKNESSPPRRIGFFLARIIIGERNKVFLALFLIFLIGTILRTVFLSQAPVDLWLDEAAIGYDSFSLLKTGKDHYGNFLPIAFKSVGDYKAPLLHYLMVPAIAIFGITEFGTRITVALFSSLTIILVFLLAKQLTKKSSIALLTTFSLAISPWHIKLGRATYEAELALFLVLLATYIFLKTIEKKGQWLWLSASLFVLAVYAYHAEKVFVPIFTIGLFAIYRKTLLQFKKNSLIALTVGIILITPIALSHLSKEVRVRAETGNLTKNMDLYRTLHKGGEQLGLVGNLLNNNFILIFNFWLKNYLDYFDPNFLFVNGMGYTLPNAPDLGLLYLFELPFVLIGVYLSLFKGQILSEQNRKLVIFWILAGPLAASLANNYQHALRFLTIIPMPQLLSAVGIWFIYIKIRNLKFKFVYFGTLSTVALFSTLYFGDLYFVQHPMIFSEYRMDGWQKAAKYAVANQAKYKVVVLDPHFGTLSPEIVSTPDIYMLFYGRIDPKLFQEQYYQNQDKVLPPPLNFKIKNIDWRKDQDKKDTLFIGSPWVLPAKDEEIVQRFYLYNGKEILRAVNPK